MRKYATVPTMAIVVTLIAMPLLATRFRIDHLRSAREAPIGADAPGDEHPLQDYLGFGYDPIADERAVNQQVARREQVIQDCMKASGFVYIPVAPDPVFVPSIDGDTELQPDGEFDVSAAQENDAYAEALSPTDRERYWTAKHGYPHDHDGFTRGEVAQMDSDGDGQLSYDETYGDSCVSVARRAAGSSVYDAATRIGGDTQRMQEDLNRDVVESGLTQVLVECVAKETGYQLSVETAVASIGADATLRELATDCIADYKVGVAKVRGPLEDEFYSKHQETIQKYGIRR